MRFQHHSEQEIQEMSLVEEGTYRFEVIEATDKTSKSGNEMIAIKLKIWDNNGKERIVFDWLTPAMEFKLRHFCVATGLLNKYESDELNDRDCVGKSGVLELVIKKAEGTYPSKNAVKDYIHDEEQQIEVADKKFNDDIPF